MPPFRLLLGRLFFRFRGRSHPSGGLGQFNLRRRAFRLQKDIFMSTLLVVGSVALDSVETPEASRTDVIGGSAVFCSYAASYFTQVNLVGVVGEDWPGSFRELLAERRIDLQGL